jgi:hypothetical protein
MPALAEDGPWSHFVGLRAGTVGIFPNALSISAFHEALSDRNFGIRSAFEITNGKEYAIYGDMGYMIDVSRVGAALDFIYYASAKRPIGTGFFMMAGIGAHRFGLKDDNDKWNEYEWAPGSIEDAQIAASFSLGFGYVGKRVGFELKGCMSNQDSAVAAGIGKNWLQSNMIFRFSMPGQQRAEPLREANYNAKRNAKRIAKQNKALESVPQHKIGLRFGFTEMLAVSGSIFYEHQLSGHWALRPAAELTRGGTSFTAHYVIIDENSECYEEADITFDRTGLALDCIYYASRHWKNGTKFYLLAGLGIHRFGRKGAMGGEGFGQKEYSTTLPALSLGVGCYFSRFIGMEYKHALSRPNSTFVVGTDRNWGQLTLNCRFPLAGSPK